MPPRSVLVWLWRMVFVPRRNVAGEHRAKVVPDPLAQARVDRREAERKLARTDELLAHARGDLWLLHQRQDRGNGNGHHE